QKIASSVPNRFPEYRPDLVLLPESFRIPLRRRLCIDSLSQILHPTIIPVIATGVHYMNIIVFRPNKVNADLSHQANIPTQVSSNNPRSWGNF
ncbi:MAG: hypothetical protein K0R34_3224, partial [Herbinix sp.]|nr:hypothetical protein [Herbinix sp.]